MLFCNCLVAQSLSEDITECGNQLFSANPNDFGTTDPQNLAEIDTSILPETIVIPVVCHLFHQSGSENLSNEAVVRMIEDCNKQLAKQSIIYDQTPDPFKQTARSVRIELRLAKIDPYGNCTDGIVRVDSHLTDAYLTTSCPGTIMEDEFISISHWNAHKYLNIYIMKRLYLADRGSSIGGQATFPPNYTGPAFCGGNYGMDKDRILINFIQGLPYLPWDEFSTTLAHEVGHWLDVYHTWTNGNNDCTEDDDYCADTPVHDDPSYACFEDYPVEACDNEEHGADFSNFMDYGDCKTHFTQGQRTRMYETLVASNKGRSALWTASNLASTGTSSPYDIWQSCPGKPKSSFQIRQNTGSFVRTFPDGSYIQGISLGDFFNCPDEPAVLDFKATASFNTQAVSWKFPGGIPATSTQEQVSVTYPDAGEYTVKMYAHNASGVDSTVKVIKVLQYDQPPMLPEEIESFEDYTTLDQYGLNTGSHNKPGWALNNDAAASGNQSIRIINHTTHRNSYLGNFKASDSHYTYLRTPLYDLSSVSEAALTFKIAKPEKSFSNNDREFNIFIGQGCYGEHSFIGGLRELEFRTVIPDTFISRTQLYIPQSAEEWRTVSVPIPEEFLGNEEPVYFLLAFEVLLQPTTYLDDLVVTTQIPSTTSSLVKQNWQIFPNPSRGQLTVSWSDSKVRPSKWQLTSISGQLVQSGTVEPSGDRLALSLPTLPSGVYIFRLYTSQGWRNKRIVINQ